MVYGMLVMQYIGNHLLNEKLKVQISLCFLHKVFIIVFLNTHSDVSVPYFAVISPILALKLTRIKKQFYKNTNSRFKLSDR